MTCYGCRHKARVHVNGESCAVHGCECRHLYDEDDYNDAVLVHNDIMAEMAEGEAE